ncbi:MAG: hypothetical protein AB7F36_11055 [Reyranellaceae bacterium]
MKAVALAVIALCAAFFLAALGTRLLHYGYYGDSLMDDAFFFVRYADNLLDSGAFSWNIGEQPVHGNTSQLYQAIVTVMHALTGRDAVLTPTVAAALGALAYLVLLPLAYAVSRPLTDPTLRYLVCAVAVALIAFDGQLFLLLGTGMETTWAMALVALSLLAAFRLQNGTSTRGAVAACGLSIAAVYAVRPDALLLALAAPAGLALFARDRGLRWAGLGAIVAALGSVGAFIGLCWICYGEPLPLAFFAKTIPFSALPPDGRYETLGYPFSHLRDTAILHMPETLLAAAALLGFTRLSPVLRGAALGMLAYVAYHLFLVLPIMGYFGRFYAPALPVLSLLALVVVEALLRHSRLPQGLRHLTASGVILLAGLGLLIASKTALTGLRVIATHVPAFDSDPALNTRAGAVAHVADQFPFFRGRMSAMIEALEPGCSIAATEDGLLSAYARGRRIVDLSGLHDARMAHEGFSAERLLNEQKPDVLAMPHPWYGDWTRAIEAHPSFARDYVVEPSFSDAGMPMAFRRDSACAQKVRRAIYGG